MTGEASLARMLGQARVLRSGFAATAAQPWDGTTAAAELAVQLGHLAQCLGRRHGLDLSMFEDPARPITDTGDELADVALAVLSIAVLSGGEPTVLPAAARSPHGTASAMAEDVALLLALVVAAGRLAESAMVAGGYRHRPPGDMPAVPEAAGTALAVAGQLAGVAGADLPAAFDAMAADAARFLAARSAGAGSGAA
jgi:hypothetical protein